jgi:YesN/AraC family two-component response regulator
LKTLLKKLGITNISIAENGKDAVKEFVKNKNNFDLVLMDINMPKLNGFEATAAIK